MGNQGLQGNATIHSSQASGGRMKKRITLKEKLRRLRQGEDNVPYLDGNGGFIYMKKEKDGYSLYKEINNEFN